MVDITTAAGIRTSLKRLGTAERSQVSAWFFKTGPGQYGEGDQFYGIKVPETRAVITSVRSMELKEITKLLQSAWHEERLAACLIMVKLYQAGDTAQRKVIYDFYLQHSDRINNWDLVDCSAEYIVGPQLEGTNYSVLKRLAQSELVWDRRIAMLACFYYIKQGDPAPAFMVAELLQKDSHDLIQKAVGWMLREIGKRIDERAEEAWLLEDGRYKQLPRTMLRYAIERFSTERRQDYLKGRL